MTKPPAPAPPIPEPGAFLERTDAGDALFLFLRAHRVLFDGIDREFRDRQGLSLALWEVLVILSKAPELRLRMVDITRQLLVSKSNVTQLIDKLEQAGMVTRELSATDRRLIYATLTPAGIEAVQRGGDTFNHAAQAHFANRITPTELQKLTSGLAKVIRGHDPDS
jgi:DNA-binding MarR family transcriptional regulator